jgi:Double zinc ribbon
MPDAGQIACSRCYATINPGWPYCSHCGSKTGVDPAPLGRATSGAVCDNCSAPVDLTGAYCWHCGVPLQTGRFPFIPEPGTPGGTDPRTDGLSPYGGATSRSGGVPPTAPTPPLDPGNYPENTGKDTGRGSRSSRSERVQRQPPQRAYRKGVGVGVVAGIVIVLILVIFTPMGSALGGFYSSVFPPKQSTSPQSGYAILDSVSVHVNYANASDQWLGSPSQNECDLINCPLYLHTYTITGSFGGVVLYLFTNASLLTGVTASVTAVSAPFTMVSEIQGGIPIILPAYPGYIQVLMLLNFPPPGTYGLNVTIYAS